MNPVDFAAFRVGIGLGAVVIIGTALFFLLRTIPLGGSKLRKRSRGDFPSDPLDPARNPALFPPAISPSAVPQPFDSGGHSGHPGHHGGHDHHGHGGVDGGAAPGGGFDGGTGSHGHH